MSQAPSEENIYLQLASEFVHHTGRHLFLTGRAGTGKTTFLKNIKAGIRKNMVIVAPTGVAAINAGGVTMHSFFNLPLGFFVPGTLRGFMDYSFAVNDRHSMLSQHRFNANKRKLLQDLELLVIDEASMLRADTLDAIDVILKHYRRSRDPFGGVQVLFIGDLYQLPPVVTNAEAPLMEEHYASPFFFDAKVMEDADPVIIELKKIYRQNEARFINLLNRVRDNNIGDDDLQLLEEHYRPGYRPFEDGWIILTSHNHKADSTNKGELERLAGRTFRYEGKVKGDFNETALPAERVLELREGAQVMFLKNDKGENRRYFNGKIGIVSRLEDDAVFVRFPGEEEEMQVEKETWKNIRYKYNESGRSIQEEELGQYEQYPIRLAWAITIHKSQGLTFTKAILDAGASFAPGQVYVALSRLTSLEGLVLHSRIGMSTIFTDERIHEFSKRQKDDAWLRDQLDRDQQAFAEQYLKELFRWQRLNEAVETFRAELTERQIPEKAKALETLMQLERYNIELSEVSRKFMMQLEQIMMPSGPEKYAAARDRIASACQYFSQQLEGKVLTLLRAHIKEMNVKTRTKQYIRDVEQLMFAFFDKEAELKQALRLATGLAEGRSAGDALNLSREQKPPAAPPKEKKDAEKEDSKAITLRLFKEGMDIAAIAAERALTAGTVENHLLSYLTTGEVTVYDFVTEAQYAAIAEAIDKVKEPRLTFIKDALGDAYSFNQIRAVLSDRDLKK